VDAAIFFLPSQWKRDAVWGDTADATTGAVEVVEVDSGADFSQPKQIAPASTASKLSLICFMQELFLVPKKRPFCNPKKHRFKFLCPAFVCQGVSTEKWASEWRRANHGTGMFVFSGQDLGSRGSRGSRFIPTAVAKGLNTLELENNPFAGNLPA
jgi:hypothetical protein